MICPECKMESIIFLSLSFVSGGCVMSTRCTECLARFYTIVSLSHNDFTYYEKPEGGDQE